MGQKVNPIGLRLGINRTWDSRWYADGDDYADLLHEDLKIASSCRSEMKQAGVSRVVIERPAKKARVTIHTARPGVVIGKKGADIEKLRREVAKMTGGDVHLNIVEIRKPEIDAQLVAENIAQQLERRVAFRRAMKRAVQSAMRMGAEGIRINCGGRLGGAEIARTEWYREGRVPLHTLRADIDYGDRRPAKTTYGTCGVKVWIFKGEIMEHDPMAQDKRARNNRAAGPRARRRLNWAEEDERCLQPKRTKFRKAHKGRIHGNAKGGTTLNFGAYGLKATTPGRITARQIEAARRAMTRHMKRAGRVWIRIFPDVPVSQKPAEVRMGKGKGSPEYWAAGSSRAGSCSRSTACRATSPASVRTGRGQAADQDAVRDPPGRGAEGDEERPPRYRRRRDDELKTSCST